MPDRSATTGAGASWITDALWPGASVSAGRRGRTGTQLVAVPHAGAPTQLLPARWTSVVAVASRPSDDRPRTKAWRDAAGIAALVAASPVDSRRRVTVAGGEGSLVDHLASTIDARIAGAVVLCGPARANRKPVLQLHDARGRTVGFAKVAWNELTRALLAHERAALEHLASRPHPGIAVPQVLGTGTFAGADWLALGRVGVERRARPTERGAMDMAVAIERTADEWTGPAAANPFVRRVIDGAAGLPRAGALATAMAAAASADELVLRAAHGDFVPWNTLSGTPAPAVWDWERYEHDAPVGYDRFHHAFQTAIFRRGVDVPAAIEQLDARVPEVVPELAPAAARRHLDWYLVDLLRRYEHDAGPGAEHRTPVDDGVAGGQPGTNDHTPDGHRAAHADLVARVDAMATVIESRRRRG